MGRRAHPSILLAVERKPGLSRSTKPGFFVLAMGFPNIIWFEQDPKKMNRDEKEVRFTINKPFLKSAHQ